MRSRLRTLLIVLVLGPPVLVGVWWGYAKWKEGQERRANVELLILKERERLAAVMAFLAANPGLPDAEFKTARAEGDAIFERLKALESSAGKR